VVFTLRRCAAIGLLGLATLAASMQAALAGTADGQVAPAATISPNCSLYAVTLTVEVLIQDFYSPNATINAKKWPRLMTEAKAARAAFTNPSLAPALPKYDDLVRRLAIVGTKLNQGRRAAAYTALKATKPDLDAVTSAARRGHVVCKSGTTIFHIG
jgi:hypothetical protein